jgi:MFS family permease
MATFGAAIRAPFPRYWLSAFLADCGDGVRLAAFPLLAAGLTRSPAAVAAVTALTGLPWLLVGVGAGVLVDRSDRRRVMLAVDTARAVVIGALAAAVLLHAAGLPLIYLTAFVSGTGAALRDTAAETAVPRLVADADLDRANGRLVAGQIVGTELAGPALGGWLFGLAAALPFAVNAGALGIAVLLLLTLPSVFGPVPGPGPARARRFGAVRQELRAGFTWLRRHAEVRNLTLAAGVISATDAAWFAVLVLYVIQVLHQPAGTYGLLLALGAVGGIAAGGTAAWLTRWIGPRRSLVIATLTLAGSQLGLGLTGNVVVAAVMLAAGSGAFAAFNVTAVTLRQRQVPAALLGRVASIYRTIGRGAEALGALLGGVLAAAAGIRAPILLGVVPLVAAAVLLSRRGPGRAPAEHSPAA